MTSKTSLSKHIISNIRQRSWLAALSIVGQFLCLPLYVLMMIGEEKINSYESITEWLNLYFPKMFGSVYNIFLVLFVSLLAVICAVTGFSYIHSKVKEDFYHSLPVKRSQWFLINYVSGLLIFLVPYVIWSLCTLLIGVVSGAAGAEVFKYSFLTIGSMILLFLVVYHTVLLGMFLTGQTVTALLASGVIFVYGSVILWLFTALAETFFSTWSGYTTSSFMNRLLSYSSPLMLSLGLINRQMIRGIMFSVSIVTIIYIIASVLIALILYKKYQSESAENALAFKKTAPFIKVLITVPFSIGVGLFINMIFFNGTHLFWCIIWTMIAAILISCVIEFIYHHDMHMIFNDKISTLVSIAAAFAILICMKADVSGYDKWMPEESRIEEMSMQSNLVNGYLHYPYGAGFDMLDHSSVKNFAPLYRLAMEGVQNLDIYDIHSFYYDEYSDNLTDLTIKFTLKNGKEVYRNYVISKNSLLKELTTLFEDEEYRKAFFPVFSINEDKLISAEFTNLYNTTKTLVLEHEQYTALLNAYEKDLLNVDMDTLAYEFPIGSLNFFYEYDERSGKSQATVITSDYAYNYYPETIDLRQLYIYESFTNTLAVLEESGYPAVASLDAEYVEKMVYNHPSETEDTVWDSEIVTDPVKIQELLNRAVIAETNGITGSLRTADESINVYFKGNPEEIYYSLLEVK